MTDFAFSLNGTQVVADLSGALWWPERRLLAVADLHFEKSSAYATKGVLLPPYDSLTTLARLRAVVERRRPTQVVVLGDSFHDEHAEARLDPGAVDNLRALVASVPVWTWLAGNHDPAPPQAVGGTAAPWCNAGPLVFRHEPQPGTAGEVAGHLHPKVRVATRARDIRARCFVTDGRQAVLPAFGSLTGGLDIGAPAVRSLFRSSPIALALGPRRVHPVKPT